MNLQTLPPERQLAIKQFCQRLREKFDPSCIILHGSVARGTQTSFSDIDIIVIGGKLAENFFTRSYELNCLRDGSVPIEIVGYTLAEWQQMMDSLHLTVLESLYWGIPLHGQALFRAWKTTLKNWQSVGLRRAATGWIVPPALYQS